MSMQYNYITVKKYFRIKTDYNVRCELMKQCSHLVKFQFQSWVGLRFPDKKHLAFKILVQVPKVWSVFIRAHAIKGKTCVESETCWKKYHEKKKSKLRCCVCCFSSVVFLVTDLYHEIDLSPFYKFYEIIADQHLEGRVNTHIAYA